MSKVIVPQAYHTRLDIYDMQKAIGMVHTIFERNLSHALHISRVSAPLFLEASTGLNDDLSGVERKVNFDIREDGRQCEVVQSLAKWKRQALKDYNFYAGHGLYTDMNAIRREEELDNLHSVYVDQWDWEKVITRQQRNLDFLKETVVDIVGAICDTEDELRQRFHELKTLPLKNRVVSFVTSQELEDMYPDLDGKGRENAYVNEHHTTCILQIGDDLKSGKPHDMRAPDYDDWQLNCDILFWSEILNCAIEISSMGIRVDAKSMDYQLNKSGHNERREFPFHNAILNDDMPLTIGGGIGQSRLCMLLLGAAHIGEVQSAVWDEDTKKICKENGIFIL
ncbi:MAG: aspartate--ammonia ligase [Bacillota bacterium]|nr:aspartate--ammonia ligase [Bacillota bacterium]